MFDPNTIYLHHSASSPETTVAEIKRWHLEKGYTDIGYHGVVTGDGQWHVGRSPLVQGAHAYGGNKNSLGICVTGDMNRRPMRKAQRKTLIQVLATWCKKYDIPPERILGHRDVSATDCPGKFFYEDLPAIREEVAKYLD